MSQRRNCAFKEGHGFDLQAGLPIMLATLGAFVPRMRAEPQEELTRKAKSKVAATYPDLAKRMSVIARVRIQVLVALNGRHDSR